MSYELIYGKRMWRRLDTYGIKVINPLSGGYANTRNTFRIACGDKREDVLFLPGVIVHLLQISNH